MRSIVLSEKQRKFAREVGSVVVGVLIALGIGEIAEAARWKVRVQTSMAAINAELSGNRYNLVERRAQQSCIEQRLAAIGRLLKEARKSGVLPDVQSVGGLAARMTQGAAYEVAKSEGVPLHMDRARASELATLYYGSAAYGALTEAERDDWQTLKLLENAPGPVSEDLLTAMLQAWSSATGEAHLIGIVAQQIDDFMAHLGVSVTFDSETPNAKVLARQVKNSGMCRQLVVDGQPYAP